jgi:Fe2+ transport system protein FeoA
LDEQGVRPGASVTVMATAEDSLLVQVGEAHISLARAVAEAIQMELEEEKDEVTSLESTTKKEELEMEPKTEATVTQIPLHELGVGQRGVVVRVGGKGPARRRMMDMGVVPGTEVKVVRVAPLGDPVEFELKGYSLSLRKSEARDITVEVPAEEAG